MRLVLAHGCFDLLHYGHLLHLLEARAAGERLVVSITADEWVRLAKGPGHPAFTASQRRAMLRELRCVDDVVVSEDASPDRVIRLLRPAIYAKGSEYIGRLPEQALVESLGGRVLFTNGVTFSSTKLMERL